MEIKKAVPKEESRPVHFSQHQKTKKVFLGGLSPETTREDIMAAMETCPENPTIADVQIMTEKYTEKPRGFGFVLFNDFDIVDSTCEKKYFKIRVGAGKCVVTGRIGM